MQLIYCDETGVNKITSTLQLLFHLLQPNAVFFFFLLAGKRRTGHLKSVMLEINNCPSSGTLKPRLDCPAAETPVFKPGLLLALECSIPIIIAFVNFNKTLNK